MVKKLSTKAVYSFLLTFSLCASLITITVYNRMHVEKLTMEQLITEKSAKTNEVISRLLYKTQTLSALVLQNNGETEEFERIAATIVDDPAILNILIAPGGVVSDVYPLPGNEAVIGLDFLKEGAGNKEAVMAKETRQLVFGGPFTLVQGGEALVGRLPVFSTAPDGKEDFWGLVSVTLKYPQALDGAGLNELLMQGFAFEIWRTNPDDGKRQVIVGSGYDYSKRTRFIEKRMTIQNAEWYFRILPVRAWYQYPETWVLIFLSMCVSLLVAFVMQNNSELRQLKSKFEDMSQTDWLTGISNRGHFMEMAAIQIERTARLKSNAFVVIFDIDRFKKINDTYGHLVGDGVLKEFVAKIKGIIRPYDLFARYGGEEFIMLITELEQEEVRKVIERIREDVYGTPIEIGNARISVAASFGIARATPENDLDTAIRLADEALYTAKNTGRNKVVVYGDENYEKEC